MKLLSLLLSSFVWGLLSISALYAQNSLADLGPVNVTGTRTVPLPNAIAPIIRFDQQPDRINAFFSDPGCDVSTCDGGLVGYQIVADNFVFANQVVVSQVIVWGGYTPNGPLPSFPDKFRVIFHADNAGSPGAVLYDQPIIVLNRVVTGFVIAGNTAEYQYTLFLPVFATLPAGTYWISVVNDTSSNSLSWAWETASQATNGIFASAGDVDSGNVPATNWMSFIREYATVLIEDVPTPVELTDFTALTDGADLDLYWTTASETNNAGFEVEVRRADHSDFAKIGFVLGQGSTTETQFYTYQVNDLEPGTYLFRLKQIDFDGAFEYSGEVEVTLELASSYLLTKAFPNPFNPQTNFSLLIANDQTVDIGVYNLLGQRVHTVFSGILAGQDWHQMTFQSGTLPSGTYLIRSVGQTFVNTQKVILMK